MSGRFPAITAPRVRYDPALVEAVTDLVLGGSASGSPEYERFRREADRLYVRYQSPEERRAAFHSLYSRFFAELGCARMVTDALTPLAGRIDEVVVARAWGPAEEGAELSADGRLVGLRMRPARFAATSELERFLRHEMGHVADMLDPAFAYGTAAASARGRRAQFVGERFGCLWDCSVDGRIERAGETPLHRREDLESACARLFPSLPREAVAVVVDRLWQGERPAYSLLVEWADHAEALAAWAGVATTSGDRPADLRPGAACPLCAFPTYAWATAIDRTTAARIQEDVPTWSPGDGACARCVEAYEAWRITAAARFPA